MQREATILAALLVSGCGHSGPPASQVIAQCQLEAEHLYPANPKTPVDLDRAATVNRFMPICTAAKGYAEVTTGVCAKTFGAMYDPDCYAPISN